MKQNVKDESAEKKVQKGDTNKPASSNLGESEAAKIRGPKQSGQSA